MTPRRRLIEYCVDSRHLAAHRATTSSTRATFKFLLFFSPPPPYTMNVRVRRVRETCCPVKSLSITYSECVCLYPQLSSTQCACAVLFVRILQFVRMSDSVIFFRIIS